MQNKQKNGIKCNVVGNKFFGKQKQCIICIKSFSVLQHTSFLQFVNRFHFSSYKN